MGNADTGKTSPRSAERSRVGHIDVPPAQPGVAGFVARVLEDVCALDVDHSHGGYTVPQWVGARDERGRVVCGATSARRFKPFVLAEVNEASLLLVVTDVSDPEADQQLATTDALLQQLGAASVPRLYVFNKLDKLDGPPDPERLSGHQPHVALSSHDEAAVMQLRERILARVRQAQGQREIFVPYACIETSRRVYAESRVLRATATPTGTQFVIEARPHVLDEIARSLRSERA
jgi:hypothetical protein